MFNNIGDSNPYLRGSNSAAAPGLHGGALNGRMTRLSGDFWKGNGSNFPRLSQSAQLSGLYQAMTSIMQTFMRMIQRFIGAGALGGSMAGAEGNAGVGIGNPGEVGTAPNAGNAGGTNGVGGITSTSGTDTAVTGETGNIKEEAKKDEVKDLSTSTDADGNIQVKTEDGWTVACQGTQQDWTITGPDGKTTRVWGDPHVVESDGDTFDFTKQSSFRFGRNKVTVEVTPYGDTGQTLTKTITVYSGRERVTITGIDENKPRIVAAADDARAHDRGLADGDVYSLGKEKNGDDQWHKRIERREGSSGILE